MDSKSTHTHTFELYPDSQKRQISQDVHATDNDINDNTKHKTSQFTVWRSRWRCLPRQETLHNSSPADCAAVLMNAGSCSLETVKEVRHLRRRPPSTASHRRLVLSQAPDTTMLSEHVIRSMLSEHRVNTLTWMNERMNEWGNLSMPLLIETYQKSAVCLPYARLYSSVSSLLQNGIVEFNVPLDT